MNPWMKVIAAVLIAATGYGLGHYIAAEAGETALAKNQSAWDAERSQLASQRADAINARMLAEQGQADAIANAAANYEKGKTDAEASSEATVAGLRSGAIRLRNEWAACSATSALVSSAGASSQPDAAADDREKGAGDLVRAAAQCDAQVVGLQQALIGERQATP